MPVKLDKIKSSLAKAVKLDGKKHQRNQFTPTTKKGSERLGSISKEWTLENGRKQYIYFLWRLHEPQTVRLKVIFFPFPVDEV